VNNKLAGLALAATLALGAGAAVSQQKKQQIDFVYFGATDCPVCRAWEAKELLELKASPAFQRVRYTKVTKLIASPVPSAFWFPREIEHLQPPIAASISGAGSPIFSLLVDGKVVTTWKGTGRKPQAIIAMIEKAEKR
jgi:hypothetical protein